MNAAAANKVVPLTTQLFLAWMEQERLYYWRGDLERFLTATGSRPALRHVAPEEWARLFAANEDPVTAALSELAKVAD